MITIETTIYNNYPLYIFSSESSITEEDIMKYSIQMEFLITQLPTKFYLAYFISGGDESSALPLIAKYRKLIKSLSLQLKDKCLASFVYTEDIVTRNIIRMMEGFTKSHHPSKLVKSVEDGYNFLNKYTEIKVMV